MAKQVILAAYPKPNWAELGTGFRYINLRTAADLRKTSGLGNSAAFYSVLVEVEYAKPFP
jgi:hypothetical protein